MIVVDASILVTALGDDGVDGERVRRRLRDERLLAPELVDLEVVSAWRRFRAAGAMDDRRCALALTDLEQAPIDRVGHRPLIARCWELRDNLTTYDAAYVAVAELVGAPLVTADERLARAPGIRCVVEVL